MSQKNETSDPNVWQINVLYDVEKTSTLILTVTKDCCTAELFEKLRQHPKAPRTDDFELISISGTVRSALVEDQEKRLSDYGITDRSTLVLVARLPGGVWPTVREVAAEPRHLRPADGITLTTISAEHPDVFWIEHDGPGVIMKCGHATAPMPLALYCLGELEAGKDEICCPECNTKWKFALLKPAACLTANEITEFEQRAHINYFRNLQKEMNLCPKCGTFSRPHRDEDKRVVCLNCTSRSGKTFEFCWTCLGEWKTLGDQTCGNPDCGSKKTLFEILANCETKELNGIEVPSKRACPNCSFIIHHDDGCKHMTCKYCRYEFCFICLKKFPCETDVFEPCDVAPRQTPETNFTHASVDIEEQSFTVELAYESSDSDTDEQDDDEDRVVLCSSNRDQLMTALMGDLNDLDINVISSDDVAVTADDDINSQPDVVSTMTISASDTTVSADKNTLQDTEDRSKLDNACANSGNGDTASQPPASNAFVQPDKILDPKEVLSAALTDDCRPEDRSSLRRSTCTIQ